MKKQRRSVDTIMTEIEEARFQIHLLTQSTNEKLADLQKRLKSGETSNKDLLTDFTIAYFGMRDEKVIEPYRVLQRQVAQNIGNEVLVVRKETQKDEGIMHSDINSNPDPIFYTADVEMQFGKIIGDLELNLQTGGIIIPTKVHAKSQFKWEVGNEFFDETTPWEKAEGNIRNNLVDLPHLYKDMIKKACSAYQFGVPQQTSEIIFGEAVEKYFNAIPRGDKAYDAARKLLDPHLDGRLF
jgi:hypothetical protein